MHSTPPTPGGLRAFVTSPAGAVVFGLLSAAVIYALVAHTALIVGLLPYALILLCPLMHLFMMRGHGHGGHGGRHDDHNHPN